MIARITKHMNEKEKGFTLIELLVVVVIIGILAAIAIPAFLNQRKNAWAAAVESDLKNASIAAESYSTQNNGKYGTTMDTAKLTENGYNVTSGVTIVTAATDTCYILTGEHAQLGAAKFYYSSKTGSITRDGAAPACS